MLRTVASLIVAACAIDAVAASADPHFARDPQQAVDGAYTAKIAEYTTNA